MAASTVWVLARWPIASTKRLTRVETAERQSGFGQLTLEAVVVSPRGCKDHTRDRDLRKPTDQGATTLAGVGEPPGEADRVRVPYGVSLDVPHRQA